ncbi:MAG: hypothetical protein WC461_00890 [Candidatus Paceibacterota bacterium]
MKTRMFLVLVVFVAFFATMTGCATYGAKGVMPNINDPSFVADKEKVATKMGGNITVSGYEISTEEESKKYFDEDLLGKSIVPIFVSVDIQKNGTDIANLIAATLNIKNGDNTTTKSPMTTQEMYEVVKRGWLARASAWGVSTYYIGFFPSVAATVWTNSNIKEDLEKSKMLNLGTVREKAKGFLCFRVPEKDMKQKKVLKLIFQKNENLLEYNLEF